MTASSLDKIAADSGTDLSARLPYGRPHTFLRELLIGHQELGTGPQWPQRLVPALDLSGSTA